MDRRILKTQLNSSKMGKERVESESQTDIARKSREISFNQSKNTTGDVEADISKRRVYVKNIPFTSQKEEVQSIIEEFGRVELLYICKTQRNQRSKTDYGFITFFNANDAQKLLKKGSLKFPRFKTKLVFREFKCKARPKRSKKARRKETMSRSRPVIAQTCRNVPGIGFRFGGVECSLMAKFHSRVLVKVSKNHNMGNLRFNE